MRIFIKKEFVSVFILGLGVLGHGARADWNVGVLKKQDGSESVLHWKKTNQQQAGAQKKLRSLPFFLPEGLPPSDFLYEEYLVSDADVSKSLLQKSREPEINPFADTGEVRTLLLQGPKENRINLTWVGDGYTVAEKEKFFSDAKRLTQEMFEGKTFVSYLPLFNVYAVFVPSEQSGITDLTPRNTALGLYRYPAGSKRAIMLRNTRAAENALKLAPATDFPLILANDDYYGGLGGRYAITTRSVQSGTVVLRHELGHNFGNVGEEYDGGTVYMGANYSETTDVPWRHWVEDTEAPVNELVFLAGEYIWKNLNTGPVEVSFYLKPDLWHAPYTLLVEISSVGWSTPLDVEVLLDGVPVTVEGVYTNDRSFFKLSPRGSLAPGAHQIVFAEKIKDGDNVLAFANLYALPKEYDLTPQKIGAYNIHEEGGEMAGYRPTHDSCLMRNMRQEHFCSIDQENMWKRFFESIRLIDKVEVSPVAAALFTPTLDFLEIRWFEKQNTTWVEHPEFYNKKVMPLGSKGQGHEWQVRVEFKTPEVRKPTRRFQDSAIFKG